MSEAIVIGAGIGGLSAAISLASRGVKVRVLELGPRAGGKAGIEVIDGVEVDTGPSLLTLPEVFGDLFRAANTSLERELTLIRPSPAFRYHYPDGTVLDVFHAVDDTLASVERTLGAKARAQLARFLDRARRIWEAGAPNFVYGEAPSMAAMVGLAFKSFGALMQIDAGRSMYRAIASDVEDERLRTLLMRYATYNGSSPFEAPATLNCIAHVELALGGYGIVGGIGALVRALVSAAESLGVEFSYSSRVSRILVEGRRVAGVELEGGARLDADVVVANAEAEHVARALLAPELSSGIRPPDPPSMSGWTAILRARRGASARPAHTVLFPETYAHEFRDIFDRDRIPEEPTIYLCAQETCHGRPGWLDDEPVFVMVNAPPEPRDGRARDVDYPALGRAVLARLVKAGLAREGDALVWTRTPAELAARFPGSHGSIYGAASNGGVAARRLVGARRGARCARRSGPVPRDRCA
ncbi:NAD(P)/FAD-dependent oxidoreductase [Myxococcota bacterium]|nr:NAD(P)/FAD-dependent oxidoreductase [Myxococcota bacterium]